MKSSIIILGCFIAGIAIAYYQWLPQAILEIEWSLYILPIMMFFVGMSVGVDLKSLYQPLRLYKLKIILVPLGTIVGTLLGCLLLAPFVSTSLRETLAIGSGFGYYSLSAVYLKELAGAEVGVIALVSNLFREIFTLLFAPLLVIGFGRMASIASAGATAIDTSLPIIARYSGEEYVVIAIFSGIVVDIAVPVLISLFYL